MTGHQDRFWETKRLEELKPDQWEALCDGCGRCCLEKLENRKTGKVYFTAVACHLLDLSTCQCLDYESRFQKVPECLKLDPRNIHGKWLPSTCAYRLLNEGKSLPSWHPLISGDPDSVRAAGISVQNFAVSGENIHPDQFESFIFQDGKL